MALVRFASLCLLAAMWLASARCLAQAAFVPLSLPEGIDLAVPAGLREVAAPAAAMGGGARVFSDGAEQPLVLWVQSGPPQAISSLPSASDESLEQLAQGFKAGIVGADAVRVRAYDPGRGALEIEFQTRAAADGAVASTFAGVAFMTRAATVLALAAAPRERAAEVQAASASLWEHSKVDAAVLAPVQGSDGTPFAVGRRIGVVLGSLLGGCLLVFALSWLLWKMKAPLNAGVAISGLVLVGVAVVGVMRSGSLDSLLQLGAYTAAAAICHAWLPKWHLRRRARTIVSDERGLSTVEYVIILVLIAAVAIMAWRSFGGSVVSGLAGADQRISDTLTSSLEDASREAASSEAASGDSSNTRAAAASRARTNPPVSSARPSPSPSVVATGQSAPAPAGAAGPQALPSADAPASSASTVAPAAVRSGSSGASTASAVAPERSPPSILERATEYVRESAPVQTALGVAYGTLQSLAPGGFVLPSPWSGSRAFEAGRGIGQVATGVAQVVTGTGMMGGGGAAAAAGGAAAPVSGGTSLVVSGAGVAVAVEGAVVAGIGTTNVAAGVGTLANAVSMSGDGSGSGPSPGAAPPAAQPLPPKAQGVLSQVKATGGQPPPGYKGGGGFLNDGRGGGQVLPKADASGKPITYKEYDVNPYQPGVNRGAERLVVGSDGKAYYTNDHYKTFTAVP